MQWPKFRAALHQDVFVLLEKHSHPWLAIAMIAATWTVLVVSGIEKTDKLYFYSKFLLTPVYVYLGFIGGARRSINADLKALAGIMYKLRVLGGRTLQVENEAASAHTALDRMPASHLSHWLQIILPTKSYERIYHPIIADEHDEYLIVIKQKEFGRAHWIKIRVWLRVIWTACASATASLLASVIGIFRSK